MDTNNLMKIIISAVIGVVVFAAILVPVVEEATTTEDTLTNEGYFRMSETSEETVIKWNPSVDATVLNVDGEDVEIDSIIGTANTSYSVAFAEDVIVRFFNTSSSAQSIQIWNTQYVTGFSSSSTYELTITINSEGLTFASSDENSTPVEVTHTGSYFIIDPEGDHVMKYSSSSAYIKPTDTIVYAGGISLLSGSTYSGFYFEGTVDDLTVTCMNSNATISDIEATYEDVDGYEGLSSLSKVTFTSTYSGTDKAQTYNYFLVPYEVTAELSVHPGTSEIALINIIPMLVLVGLVLGVVGAVIARRD